MQRPSRDSYSIASVVTDDDDESTVYSVGSYSYHSNHTSRKPTDNNKEFNGSILKNDIEDNTNTNSVKRIPEQEEEGTEATRSLASDHSSTAIDNNNDDTEETSSSTNNKVASVTAAEASPPADEWHRYALYVATPCPFSCRPWAVVALYGLPVNVVKVFPAIYDQGWFFSPTNDGEADLVHNFPQANYNDHDPVAKRIRQENKDSNGNDQEEEPQEEITHLKQVYYRANPDFEGATSVPLLWDTVEDAAISNASVGVSEMLYTHLKPTEATRNHNIQLFPNPQTHAEPYAQHAALVEFLHAHITQRPYQIFFVQNGVEHDEKVQQFYQDLRELEQRVQRHGQMWANMTTSNKPSWTTTTTTEEKSSDDEPKIGWLMPPPADDEQYNLTFADLVFWITLIRMDLAYQWRFGMGQYSIREDFPGLQRYMNNIFAMEGIKECVLPRDIMAGYYMSRIWTDQGNGRNVPQVPFQWASSHGL
mmetsp:Transcript_2961/g.7515  ORF Transcript_2961/g.7515 Transcript_2961/m.7515 type:complete len:478 (-) Transcript_2961:27-1460(-)